MPTLKERESLMRDFHPRKSGFTPRPVEKMATQKKPHQMINIECNHFLRTSTDEATHGLPPLPYRMWQEATKHEPPFPERPDDQYNSNVWRNFRRHYGFHMNTKGQSMSEMIAVMYPLNIPAPSKVGDYTYEKFLREISLIKDEKLRRLAIERTRADVDDFKRLRLRSDSRNPPIDTEGSMMPPQNYKQYAHRFVAPEAPGPSPPPPVARDSRIDMFGRTVPAIKRDPHLFKLSYKLNHPDYYKLQQEVEQRKKMAPRHPSMNVQRVGN